MQLLGKECEIVKGDKGYYLKEKHSGFPFTTNKVSLHSLAEQSGLACEYSRKGVFPWFPSEENLMKFIDFVNNSALEHWKSWYKKMTGKDI